MDYGHSEGLSKEKLGVIITEHFLGHWWSESGNKWYCEEGFKDTLTDQIKDTFKVEAVAIGLLTRNKDTLREQEMGNCLDQQLSGNHKGVEILNGMNVKTSKKANI